MTDFFEVPNEPQAHHMHQTLYRMDPWVGAPPNYLPVLVPTDITLGRSDRAVIQISGIRAYPEGFEFTLITMLKLEAELFASHDHDMMMQHQMMGGMPLEPGAPLPDELPRFGFEFVDGQKVTSIETMGGHGMWTDGVPTKPLLNPTGGGSSAQGGMAMNYWCWPIPPEGPLLVRAEWPAVGIDMTTTEIDTALIRAAAARAEQLWEDLPERPKPPETDEDGTHISVRIM